MRVVAGRFGGRVLKAPPGDATRPTAARVKEAIFSILGDVRELKVLDLYAGSGALGIEALSRGASFVAFLESSRAALSCLRDNLTKLGAVAETRVLPVRAELALPQLTPLAPFQLLLCDPPWKDVAAALAVLQGLAKAGLASPGARIVLEHAARSPLEAGLGLEQQGSPLVIEDQRRWGDTAVTLLGIRSDS